MRGDPAHQIARIHGAGLARDLLTVAENNQSWNAADAKACGDILCLFGIELGEAITRLELVGSLGEGRRHHAAGTAPGRPAIHDHRDVAAADMIIK